MHHIHPLHNVSTDFLNTIVDSRLVESDNQVCLIRTQMYDADGTVVCIMDTPDMSDQKAADALDAMVYRVWQAERCYGESCA